MRVLGTIIQTQAHQYGPCGRLWRKCAISYWLPEYQATKNSIPYAYPTRRLVRRRNLFISSRCRMRTTRWSLNTVRAMRRTVSTIAKPLKTAPATKYGGKIVVCQPGMTEVAKSILTTEWTERTSGVEIAARIRYARS